MEKFLEIAKWIFSNGPELITAIVGVLAALILFFSLIPGEQPEKTLQKILEFLKKFSRK